MKFLIISETGSSLGIASRIQEEGNEVVFWIRKLGEQDIGRGLVHKAYDWNVELDRDTVIIADCVGSGVWLDLLRKSGFTVVGGSEVADRLEMDRKYADSIMKSCDIQVPKSWEFHDFEKAKAFVQEHDQQFVFKPSGESSGILPSHVSSGQEELLEYLETAQNKLVGEVEFDLQEFIEGEDVSTEGWFDGDKFIEPFNHTIESKKFLDGELGSSVGCAGNVVWPCSGCILSKTLLKATPFFKKHGYVGPIDANFLVSEDGVYCLEFTPRFGYDATPTLFWELLEGDFGRFFSVMGRGGVIGDFPFVSDSVAGGIRLTIAPYPASSGEFPGGVVIEGDSKHFYPYGICYDEKKNKVTTARGAGPVGVATSLSSNIHNAMGKALRVAKSITYNEKQHRTDLGEIFAKKFEKLQSLMKQERF